MNKHIKKTLNYGSECQQFGQLIQKASEHTSPVVIVIHGGYWKDNHSLDTYATSAIVEYLKSFDVAIWNLEYRRMESSGVNSKAPWPAVHEDVGNGIDFLQTIANDEKLDLSRILVIGHSAGGHLAVWAGCRGKISSTSVLFKSMAVEINNVLSIAGVLNISRCDDIDQPEQVTRLMGGTFKQFPERYQACDPNLLQNPSLDLTIVHGNKDSCVGITQATNFGDASNRTIEKILMPDADHFSMLPHEGLWKENQWQQVKTIIADKITALI
jgi:acetyl esterase/lipase